MGDWIVVLRLWGIQIWLVGSWYWSDTVVIKLEIWKDIKDYEGLYQVSNLGRVRSLPKVDRLGRVHNGKIKAQVNNGSGYLIVNLKHNGKQKMKTVHRLVAETFISNDDNLPEINHIDGNKVNNRVDNLEWCTRSENVKHAIKNG